MKLYVDDIIYMYFSIQLFTRLKNYFVIFGFIRSIITSYIIMNAFGSEF